jgi:hypothetical protein
MKKLRGDSILAPFNPELFVFLSATKKNLETSIYNVRLEVFLLVVMKKTLLGLSIYS